MNGQFFTINPAVSNPSSIPSMPGKYICHYFDTNEKWVMSKEPERSASATGYGAVNEWETLLNLQTNAWLPVPVKSGLPPSGITGASIVDVNVIGSYVDYVVQYKTASQYYYYRDRNIDGVMATTNYSVRYQGINSETGNAFFTESILGPYDNGQTYIKLFNNSVMIYPHIRMVTLRDEIVSYSYTETPNFIGAMLIPYGDLADNVLAAVFSFNSKTYIITKTETGYIRIIRLGTNIPNRIERMAQYVHRINTVDPFNILVERETRITNEPGSLDWNNKFEIVNNITSNGSQEVTGYMINSAYNPFPDTTGLRSSSIIADDISINLYGQIFNNPADNTYSLNFFNTLLDNENIDIFYDTGSAAVYKYSLRNGIQTFDSRYEDLPFPPGIFVPFPLCTKWSLHNEVVAVGELSLYLLAPGETSGNRTLDLYNADNEIYFGQDAFTLFGIQYVFDGDYIYQQDNEDRIAMAFGYMFIGCDNNSAYFYNPWDKSVYLFNGARSLTKAMNLSNRNIIDIGRYDGFSGEMVLLAGNEILKSREKTIMNFPYSTGGSITPTKKGPYIELADGRRVLLSPLEGDTDVYEVITEFIGVDGSTLCDYERIDVRLYSPEKKPIEFTVEMQTINQDTKESEQKRIVLMANDWSIDGYKTIKLIPQYKKGTGLSLRIYCEKEINVSGIEFTYSPVTRTANSQRSGF